MKNTFTVCLSYYNKNLNYVRYISAKNFTQKIKCLCVEITYYARRPVPSLDVRQIRWKAGTEQKNQYGIWNKEEQEYTE